MQDSGVTLVPVQRADPRARSRALLFLACFVPLLVPLSLGVDALAVHVRELAKHDRAAASTDLWWILAVGGPLLILPILVLAVSIFRTATLAHRAGRFPPPGTRTALAVRVLEGRAARGVARVHQAIAVALAGCAVTLAWLLRLALACLERSSVVV